MPDQDYGSHYIEFMSPLFCDVSPPVYQDHRWTNTARRKRMRTTLPTHSLQHTAESYKPWIYTCTKKRIIIVQLFLLKMICKILTRIDTGEHSLNVHFYDYDNFGCLTLPDTSERSIGSLTFLTFYEIMTVRPIAKQPTGY